MPAPLKGQDLLAAGRVPYFHLPGLAKPRSVGAGQVFAVGAEGHATSTALEGQNFLAAGHVPQLHRRVP